MADSQNRLIETLPRKDRERLLALCELVDLALTDVPWEPGTKTRHVYFPKDWFISLITVIGGSPGLEVGMIGREGMLGAQLALGVATAPLRVLSR